MNPFTQMASVLSRRTVDIEDVRQAVRRVPSGQHRYNGNTARVRAAIQAGPITAKEIANVCGLSNSGMVMALIHHDVDKGLIIKQGSTYRMANA